MISVIIPFYNVAPFIEECLDSVAKQTYTDLEVLLIDDCGSDESLMLAERFCATYNGPIRFRIVHHSVNRGLSAARNTGLDEASGEYISFVDSDDYIAPDYFQELYDLLSEHPDCGIATCSCWLLMEDGTLHQPYNPSWNFDAIRYIEPNNYAEQMLMQKSMHTAWGKLFRSELLKNTRFREGFNNEDTLFALDFFPVIERQQVTTIEAPAKLYYYRQRDNSISRSNPYSFQIEELRNLGICIRELVGKQLLTKQLERKYLMSCLTILQGVKHSGYASHTLYKKAHHFLSDISNKEAKGVLNAADYKSFLLYKYLPLVLYYHG